MEGQKKGQTLVHFTPHRRLKVEHSKPPTSPCSSRSTYRATHINNLVTSHELRKAGIDKRTLSVLNCT